MDGGSGLFVCVYSAVVILYQVTGSVKASGTAGYVLTLFGWTVLLLLNTAADCETLPVKGVSVCVRVCFYVMCVSLCVCPIRQNLWSCVGFLK